MKREQLDALVLYILEQVQAMRSYAVEVEDSHVLIHLFLAEGDLLDQHGHQSLEGEVQVLGFLQLLEPFLLQFAQVQSEEVLL